MHIKFKPQDKNYPKDKSAMTNVGSFLPGDVRSVSADMQREADRLIAGGDFVESDVDGKEVRSSAKLEEVESKKTKK